MPRFRYKAVAGASRIVEGEAEAADRAALLRWMTAEGYLPIAASEVSGSSLARVLRADLRELLPVPERLVAQATGNFADLLEAGLPVDGALRVLIDADDTGRLRAPLSAVLGRVVGGAPLSEALAEYPRVFPRHYVAIVRAGEIGGALAPTLARLAASLERAATLKQDLRSALLYPAFLVAVAALTVMLMLTLVLPQFQSLFDEVGRDLPLATRLLLAVADGVRAWWWAAAVLLLAAPLLGRSLLTDPRRRLAWHGLLLRLPVAGRVLQRIEMARLARTLGTLLRNGVPLLQALEVTRASQDNAAVADALRQAAEGLQEGVPLATRLGAAAAMAPLVARMVQVGHETGRLDHMLLQLADMYDRQVKLALDRLMALLVPAITILLGLFVGFILVAILSAVLSINEVVL